MYDRPADDPTEGVVELVRLDLRTFMRAHNDREEELTLQRRRLLQGMLSATGLYVTDAVLGAASAHATSQESAMGSGEQLSTTTRALHEICVQHMAGARVEASQERAVACWRDALAVKVNASGPRAARAAEAESKAACLVAQFYGDLGSGDLATRWYARALEVAPEPDLAAWIHSCSAWIPMYRGDGEGVVKAATSALKYATVSNPIQEAFAFNQLARGHAIRGDHESALTALDDADEAFNRYGYYGKNASPSLDGFTRWQHSAYAASTYAMLGEVVLCRAATAILRDQPFVNGMNYMLSRTSEATCLVHEGNVDGGVALVRETMDSLSRDDASTAVVRGRVEMFINQIPTEMADARNVRDFREYLAVA